MSEGSRAIALQEAVKFGTGALSYEKIIDVAELFNTFIEGGTAPAKTEKPIAKVEKKAAPKIEPKVEKPAVDNIKMVSDKINELLKANKRPETVALLATFNGAKNATMVVAEGDEAVASFLEQADGLLLAG
jgi:hypothetical protein